MFYKGMTSRWRKKYQQQNSYHNFQFYNLSCTSRFGGIIGRGAMKAISLSAWMRVVSGWYQWYRWV